MNVSREICPYSSVAFVAQGDPFLLSEDELIALDQHLSQEPRCPACEFTWERRANALLVLSLLSEAVRREA
jgi:hypothetical protein